MAAGSSLRRRVDQAASASRFAALIRITVDTMAFSNLKYPSPRKALTALGDAQKQLNWA